MIHPRRPRFSLAGRLLALCLAASYSILFGATELTHRHSIASQPGYVAALGHHGLIGPSGMPTPRTLSAARHNAPLSCAICEVAQSTAVSMATVQPYLPLAGPTGHAPAESSIYLPKLLVGLSSARAPPSA